MCLERLLVIHKLPDSPYNSWIKHDKLTKLKARGNISLVFIYDLLKLNVLKFWSYLLFREKFPPFTFYIAQ